MTSELKPCPFCGERAKLKGGRLSQENYTVWCENLHKGSANSSKEKAIADWNTRAVPDVPELVTVGYQHLIQRTGRWDNMPSDWSSEENKKYQDKNHVTRELVTKDQADAVIAAKDAAIPILKGTAFKSGDGWKETTKNGDVCFVWNKMHPTPFAYGQYPRIGKEHWSASVEYFKFEPATIDEIVCIFATTSKRAEAAEAELAQREKQEAVGYVVYYALKVGNGRVTIRQSKIMDRVSATSCHSEWLKEASKQPNHFVETVKVYTAPVANEPSAKQALQIIADLPLGKNDDITTGHEDAYRAVESLFTSPPNIVCSAPVASDADLRAETIEQCRKAVRNAILRMTPDHRANGDICDDVIAHALAALNPSEPQT